MTHIGQDSSLSDAIAAQPVRDEASWLVPKAAQQLLEDPLASGAISPLLHQNIQDDAMLINGAPQVVLHASDADEHFSRCQVSPGRGRRRCSLLAKSVPIFRH